MNTRKWQNNNGKIIGDNIGDNNKMLGLFGPGKHSTLNYLDPWMIKEIFSSKSKMK